MKSFLTAMLCVLMTGTFIFAASPVQKHSVSEDGSIETMTSSQTDAIRFSEVPDYLAGEGYAGFAPILRGYRDPRIDEIFCGIPPEADVPLAAAVTPDGTRAVHTFFLSGTVGIQNLTTYAWDNVISAGKGAFGVAVTPSGSHALVACTYDNAVVAVNLSTYAIEHTVPVGQSPVNLAIAADGSRTIVLNSDDDTASVIELTGWTVERTVTGISNGVYLTWNSLGRFCYEPTEVRILNDNETAVVPAGETVEFINMSDGSVTSLPVSPGVAKDLDITRDGTRMAVAGYGSQEVTFIDLTQTPPAVNGGIAISGYWYNADMIKFTADGSLLALGQVPDSGGYTYLTFYDTATYQPVPGFSESNGGIAGIALSPDGNTLLSVGYNAVYVDLTSGLPVKLSSEPAYNIFYFADSSVEPIAVGGMSLIDEMTAVYDYSLTGYGRLNYAKPGILPEGDGPKHIVMSGDGSIALTADLVSDTVSFIDPIAGTVLDCIDVGNQPYHVEISPDGSTALSCDREANLVSVIDVASRTVWTQLPSQARPANCVFSPDGTRAYVVTVGANPNDYLCVYDIDGASSSHVANIDLGLNMYGFYILGAWTPNPAITPDGLWVVVPGANPSNKCAVIINTVSLAVETQVSLASTPEMPFYAAVNPAGDRAIIVDGQGNTIHFIELNGASSQLLHSMSPGVYPFQAVYSADGSCVYINNWNSNTIAVIDTTTYGIVKTVAMPGTPSYMVPTNNKLFVACEVNDPVNPTINIVSMAGSGSTLLASYEKDYYSYFIGAFDAPPAAVTNCMGWDTCSWLHDPDPAPTDTPGPPTDTPLPTDTPAPPTDTPVQPTDTPAPPTQTSVPTNTLIPTFTPRPPTDTPLPPTNTPVPPTDTPVPPTDTPAGCDTTGVGIIMPSDFYRPGDECYCNAIVCNAGIAPLIGYPLFVILDVYGMFFFAPSFGDFDYYTMNFEIGETTVNVLPAFTWPESAGSASGILWYCAMTDPGITQLFGEMDTFTFAWGE
ncbi:hypothetical protein JXA40_11830 [bacterium]|nr:hypothetical protein [candidate division CSSED10-310 bacterium]